MDNLAYTVIAEGTVGINNPSSYIEERHYSSLQQAVASVLERDFNRFGVYREPNEDEPHLKKIVVESSVHNVQYLQLKDIPIKDVVSDGRAAGIYLQYRSWSAPELQEAIGIPMPKGNPSPALISLAKYHYDGNFKILPDMGLITLATSLKNKPDNETPGQFRLQTTEISNDQTRTYHHHYHFAELKQAFSATLNVDIEAMDDKIAESNGKSKMLFSAVLYDKADKELVIFSNIIAGGEANALSPGVYLNFPAGVTVFEKQAGIQFNHLLNQDGNEQYLKIGRYYMDQTAIIPTAAFILEKWALSAGQHAKPHYMVSIEYNSKFPEKGDGLLTQEIPYSKLSDAFEHINRIDKSYFDRYHLKQIEIQHWQEGPFVSKIKISAEEKSHPEGIYVMIVPSILSLSEARLHAPGLQIVPDFKFPGLLLLKEQKSNVVLPKTKNGNYVRRTDSNGKDSGIKTGK